MAVKRTALTQQNTRDPDTDDEYEIVVDSPKLPYGMAPAPAVEMRVSKPVDLGQYNGVYKGWQVVYDLSTELGLFDLLDDAMTNENEMKKLIAMRIWIERACVAWNFTRIDPITQEVSLIPQPREGGAHFCRLEVLMSLSKGFAANIRPPKKLETP